MSDFFAYYSDVLKSLDSLDLTLFQDSWSCQQDQDRLKRDLVGNDIQKQR